MWGFVSSLPDLWFSYVCMWFYWDGECDLSSMLSKILFNRFGCHLYVKTKASFVSEDYARPLILYDVRRFESGLHTWNEKSGLY